MGTKTTLKLVPYRKMKAAKAKKAAKKIKHQQIEFPYPQDSKHLMSTLEKESSNRHIIRY
jgi:hypothetical protein